MNNERKFNSITKLISVQVVFTMYLSPMGKVQPYNKPVFCLLDLNIDMLFLYYLK